MLIRIIYLPADAQPLRRFPGHSIVFKAGCCNILAWTKVRRRGQQSWSLRPIFWWSLYPQASSCSWWWCEEHLSHIPPLLAVHWGWSPPCIRHVGKLFGKRACRQCRQWTCQHWCRRLTQSSWRDQHYVDASSKKSLEVSAIFYTVDEVLVFRDRTMLERYLVHKLTSWFYAKLLNYTPRYYT